MAFDNFLKIPFLSGNVKELDLKHNSKKRQFVLRIMIIYSLHEKNKIGGNVYAVKNLVGSKTLTSNAILGLSSWLIK
jgi:hypothetical protein